MAEAQQTLQRLSEEYRKLQEELQAAIQSRQKLDAQKHENVGVQKEFEKLKSDEVIYKLVGPVLLKQDKAEAESTVSGRLKFITKEMARVDDQIKDIQSNIEKKKTAIIEAQGRLQQAPNVRA